MNIHSADIPSAKTVPAPGQPKVNAEEIKFATGKSKFGIVLVARSARGQRDRPGYPVSSCGHERWRTCRLALGHRAQAEHGREGGGARMNIHLRP